MCYIFMYNMHNLIGFQRDLLRLINGLNEPTDTNIKNSMEDYYGKDIDLGRIRINIDVIVKYDYIEKEIQRDKRYTHRYLITNKGKNALKKRDEWVNEQTNN